MQIVIWVIKFCQNIIIISRMPINMHVRNVTNYSLDSH